MMTILGGFAQIERAMIRERQRAEAGETKAALAREFGISRETLLSKPARRRRLPC
ncbi:hypothetical protein CBA19CS22_17900 [Caballeronia novacaledonica]|uniref:Uncharacterized protein n=1 Tax=Caballeronia novacaledonica TaxID=1544861 RepID=A0ACB5QTE8_9BURK|nr:hypothetical protein CBA19CS22_17900 [Caballeronia novacaledonica]